MRLILLALLACLSFSAPLWAETFKDRFPDVFAKFSPADQKRLEALQLLRGTVTLGNELAQIAVPAGYYFLAPADASVILEGVLPDPNEPSLLGVLVPDTMTTFGPHEWFTILEFNPVGFVSQDNTSQYDFGAALYNLKKASSSQGNPGKRLSLPSMTVAGWAASPFYLKSEHKLVWAEHLVDASGADAPTSYNSWLFGRKGVLELSLIAGPDQLAVVRKAEPGISKSITFLPGNAYADFDPKVDKAVGASLGDLIVGHAAQAGGPLSDIMVLARNIAIFVALVIAGFGFWRQSKAKGVATADGSNDPA